MFLQNLFASIAIRRRRSAQQNLEKTGAQLPKRWQELLDVARQKQIKTHPRSGSEVSEPSELREKNKTIAGPHRPSRAFRDGWGL